MKLTEKQRRFVDAYIETGNAAEASRRAGYSAKIANRIGTENMSKPVIQNAIQKRLLDLQSIRTANLVEVMEYLTSSMRGEIKEEVVVEGEGCSSACIFRKQISARDRLKAAELLLKRYPAQLDIEEQQLRIAKAKAEVDELQQSSSKDDITFTFDRKAVRND
ncbi:terminase small subunit [uncultured Megasphaera sp.]|uniref:terminase small subunit n=1 Tax=uncultured Megasphaera sp. TaxID=165188 RepID=UPI00206B4D73|nr:terminase small subunit [uncultured Megasphaera sp.]DAQ39032.1 MAG TPA: Terminase small subunit [Caudoviricetes sp.]